ncbi:putative nucleotide exchange factor sil1 protein [Botrytis fragariae]|uniref:Putative nucleotide exchange factor sil1 protein n=1 Tax=Botrytis fragariae TaxID=1964551 RepID=A0A8H6AYI9_9HELO|nr:putative nucleotide exchange factor sil1 protein [Botrytis fragariae]KAF5876161.1 putative nucleotide exchange factor sil1 protein [Botrytis fragariae]
MTTNNPVDHHFILIDALNLESESEDSNSAESLASLESDTEERPPERILTEIVGKNNHIWYLVKWKDCPLLRSSWEGEACFENYPWVFDQWLVNKQGQKEGKIQPFDLHAFDQACKDLDLAERQRRILRRFRRKAKRLLSVVAD